MLIGSIDIELEDSKKDKKITEDIGYNPNKRNIPKIPNLNLNTIKEKKNEDLEKITLHYLELLDSKKDETKKIPKKPDNAINNNFFENILYPEAFSEKNTLKKTVAYDGGTFLTDKINISNIELKSNKEKKTTKSKDENITSIITNSNINNLTIKTKTKIEKNNLDELEPIPELKKGIPVSFDKLIVNIKDGKNTPKPINPLFFIINGDKPFDKTKFINFRTNPSLFTTTMTKKNFVKNIEDYFNKKNKTDLNNSHILSHMNSFSNCFNKTCENKNKLNYDLKKRIFNDKNTFTEEKYKLLKDLNRNELMNRALGRGIFSCNKYFDDEKRALVIQRRNQFEKYLEDSKEKLVLNLRKEEFFDDKKKSFSDSQNIITQNYLPIVEDNKKSDYKELKDIFKIRTGKINKNVEGLYKPEIRQRISNQVLVDYKMDRVLKKARFDYEKPYSYLASNINKDKAL